MAYKVVVSPEALREIDLAVCYFKSIHLEKSFFKDIREQLVFLEELPLSRQIRYTSVRIHLFKKFRCSIHYVVLENEVRILHVLNQKQDF